MSNEFTLNDAIAYQSEHLSEWKTKLIPECYNALEAWAMQTNETTSPYDVRRGSLLSGFVANWKPTP